MPSALLWPGGRMGCGGITSPGDQGSGQSGEKDAQAAFDFGGAVVGGQDGGEASQLGEFADRQVVKAEPQHVVGFVGILDEFLELVEHVAVQEPELLYGKVAKPVVGLLTRGAFLRSWRLMATGGFELDVPDIPLTLPRSGTPAGRTGRRSRRCGW